MARRGIQERAAHFQHAGVWHVIAQNDPRKPTSIWRAEEGAWRRVAGDVDHPRSFAGEFHLTRPVLPLENGSLLVGSFGLGLWLLSQDGGAARALNWRET